MTKERPLLRGPLLHPDSVQRLIRQGKIPAFEFANKWLIRKNELEQFALVYDSGPGRKATLF
ncbi:MAG: helix-turn-helix domain-containing protein [Anaerolineales bacterium]|nr:helix-turn-helix domain-containing protein [Anaerolineales bacterium]